MRTKQHTRTRMTREVEIARRCQVKIKGTSYVFPVALAVVTTLAGALAETTLIAQAPSNQASSSGSAKASSLKTPWGAPDLQGIWSNEAVVPFERPKQFGDRQFMTEAEHQKALEALLKRNERPGRDSREGRGTEKDVARAYNDLWFEKRTQVSYRTSQIIDPPDGRMPALIPEAQARITKKHEYLVALLQGTSGGKPGPTSPLRSEPPPDYNLDRMNRADGPEDRSSDERCLLNHLPAGGVSRIVQSAESVDFYYDIGQGTGFNRLVPITNRPHLPKDIHQYWGDSIGRWEGDTLVVDVTNFSQETDFRGSRENLHLIERYKRLDATTLQVTITAEDPTTWVRPFTFVEELKKNPDKPNRVYEGGCQEGNYALLGMLANTRAAEKLFSEGKGPDPAREDLASGGGDDSPNNPLTAPQPE
jgi:hypothetical protein